MTFFLHNTLSGKKEPFVPTEPGQARVYVCGPTVYDDAHLGHVRCYIVYDVLIRHLRKRGLSVTYARNVTDIDDKIVRRARERNEDTQVLAERYYERYREDMARVGNLAPDIEPKVSQHLREIVELIQDLIQKGYAYVSQADVYFDVTKFESYGKLSHRQLSEMMAGASGRTDDEELKKKRHPFDFALWKASAPDEPFWPSPWGNGRPGWHIECSAMSMRYLGESFDIHGGGLDLVFPHHENELAQSEAATGRTFAKYWLHNGFVQVDKEKMAKSRGNFFTARQVFQVVEPEAIRYAMLTVHYRAPFNLDWQVDAQGEIESFPQFEDAERRLEYLYTTRLRLARIPANRVAEVEGASSPNARAVAGDLARALDDDLDMPGALAQTAEFLHAVNELCDRALGKKGQIQASDLALAQHGFVALAETLGLGVDDPERFLTRVRDRRAAKRGVDCGWVARSIAERDRARKDRDFARADAIRQELGRVGVELLDTPAGTDWRLES